MKRSEMVTRKDFYLRSEWDRPNYGDLTPRTYYNIYSVKKGKKIGGNYSSKKAAYAYIGKVCKLLNGIKSGKYVVEDGKVKLAPCSDEKEMLK